MGFQPDKLNHLKDLVAETENKVYGRVKKQWLLIIIIAAVLLIILLLGGLVWAYEARYQDKFFPGSRIGDFSLEGLTITEATGVLNQLTKKLEQEEIQIIYQSAGNSYLKITPAINALNDPDLSRELLRFNNQQTIEEAFRYGRDSGRWQNLVNQIKMFNGGKSFAARYTLDETLLRQLIIREFAELEAPAKNASPLITWRDENYQIDLLPEQAGATINYDEVVARVKENLSQLVNHPINITETINEPLITMAAVRDKTGLIDRVLATTSPTLLSGHQKWLLPKYELSQMLEFQYDENKNITVGLNQERFAAWLDQNIAAKLDMLPKDASIEIVAGRITKFEAHRDGRQVNFVQTYQALNSQIGRGGAEVEVIMDIIAPKVATSEINDLGIKEIIGTGHSNFAGSPANRRHNIRVGAQALHGLLIKPGEEFSLIKALGKIDGSSGYLQELVIKGNQTVPEYGGGLCQIGTTIFRATMASGLPITARRNHSYSVSYYLENGLPGTDATIYNPNPDFRFINDTGNYILIQMRIEGDNLYFDFWGAKDGRQAERTTPRVWGWTAPPPTKYIETLDLAPGVKRCSESSHQGVNAAFDYTITYSDGRVDKTTFTSYYRPWQAVCLIGVEKLSAPETTTIDESAA